MEAAKKWKCKITFSSGKSCSAYIFQDKMNFVIGEEANSKQYKILVREKYHKMAFD